MKKILYGIFTLIISLNISAQTAKTDTTAIMLLDQMSSIIGDLTSVSFTLNTRNDVNDPLAGPISNFGVSDVYFYGPDNLLVNSTGFKGHRGLWFNGEFLAIYWYSENNYAVVDAPPSTIAMIDSVNSKFGIEFPAADFFFPTFTEDLLNNSSEILFLRKANIEGKDCFHVVAKQKEMTIQIWISDDSLFLPVKLLIMYHGKNEGMQYEATFSNWKINPELPLSMFSFLPPPGAKEILLMPKY